MRANRHINIVNAHAEGEVGNVITAGVLDIPGATMLDKMRHLNETDDSLRRFCLHEPRGRLQMSVNVLLAPTRDDADAGFIIMQSDQAHAMSGSNCICVVTVLLETGIIAMTEPQTVVRLDTPAGLVVATAQCADGVCERVSLEMVPSFVEQLDAWIEVEGIGTVRVDTAFGGCYYVLVEAAELGMDITPETAAELCALGQRILHAAREQCTVRHPLLPGVDSLVYVMFMSDVAQRPRELRNCTVMPPGRIDRSPCGTGSSARLAVLHARGLVETGDSITMRSTIDSCFETTVTATTRVGDRDAIVTRVSGRGWVFGTQTLSLDPGDPYPLGYSVDGA